MTDVSLCVNKQGAEFCQCSHSGGLGKPEYERSVLIESALLMMRKLSLVCLGEIVMLPHPFVGSSDIRWGSGYESSGGQEHSEAVVVSVAVAAGQAAVELDDPVDGFGAAIG
jgi:hypothetical protein